MGKTRLALETYRDDAASYFDWNTRIFQLLGRLFAEVGQYLRHGVGKSELVRIGLLAQGFNIAQLLLPQLINALFKGHCVAEPRGCKRPIINERIVDYVDAEPNAGEFWQVRESRRRESGWKENA